MGESSSKPVSAPTPLSQGLGPSKMPSLTNAQDKIPTISDRMRQSACAERLFDLQAKLESLPPSSSSSDASTCDSEAEHSTVSTSTSSSQTARPRKRISVRLHVYDLGRNTIASLTKLQNSISKDYGLFHTAVEVYGLEWSFGRMSGDQTGVVYTKPKMDSAHSYRETIEMGSTALSPKELGSLIGRLCDEWPGNSYDLLTRNCNHFSEALLQELGVDHLPSWCNSLAGKPVGLSDWLLSTDSEFDGGNAIWDFFGFSGSEENTKLRGGSQRSGSIQGRPGARGFRR